MVRNVIQSIENRFKRGTIAHGPVNLRFFGLNIIHNEEKSIENNGDDNLNVLEAHPISRNRRRGIDEPLNIIEKRIFLLSTAQSGG